MYAVFTEVNADESHTEAAREYLPKVPATRAREAGAKAGFWLAPQGGRGVAVVVFEDEATARQMAEQLGTRIGQSPFPEAPPGVTLKTVEVREVLASVA